MPCSRLGESVPEVTSPPPSTGLPWRAMPGPVRTNGTSFSCGPASRVVGDRLGADEAGGLLHAPAEAGLDRAARLHQVVAVEVKADLEPQRVARAQARGLDAGLEQRVPDRGRVLGGDQQLDAVLARVAGAADEHAGRAGDRAGGGPEALGQLAVGQVLRRSRARRGPGRPASRSRAGGLRR